MSDTNQLLDDWSAASESSKPITPFTNVDDALSECGIRWEPSQDFLSEQENINILESNPLATGEPFAPELNLPINVEQTISTLGIDANKVRISACIRDRSLWQFTMADSWQLGSHPSTYKIDAKLVAQLAGHRGFAFSISLYCDGGATDKDGNKLPDGALLANKTLYLDVKNEDASGGFPVLTCDPDEFDGINKNATWFISWQSMEKLNEPNLGASDILTVYINKKCSDRLYHLKTSDEVGQILWMEMASEILLEISLVILNHDELPRPVDEARGFVPRIVRALMKQTQLTFDELCDLARNRPEEASSAIRSHLQAHINLTKTISQSRIGNQHN